MTQNWNPVLLVEELRPLRDILPGITDKWISKTAWNIWQLEKTGATSFGGPVVLAWWIVQRCQPKAPLTNAQINKLRRKCRGSQHVMNALVGEAQDRGIPRRLRIGWTKADVNKYLWDLQQERGAA